MPRIRFSSEQIYETGAPGKGQKFPEGFVLDGADVGNILHIGHVDDTFVLAFLNRWVQRGTAEFVGDDIDASDPGDIFWAGTKAPVDTSPADPESDNAGIDDDLADMTRAQLNALAAERQIDVSTVRNKADVIAALRAAASNGDVSKSA